MLISSQSEEASTYNIFVKCNLDAPLPWMPGPSPRLQSRPLCTPLVCRELGNYGIFFNLSTLKKQFRWVFQADHARTNLCFNQHGECL